MTQNKTPYLIHSRAGFTLLEVMIALLIFSIGLLGLAGLQGSSLQNNKTADLRSIAIIAAHDMAERIRANQRDFTGDYDAITVPAGAVPVPAPNCITSASCTSSANIAAWDNYEWQTSLRASLPSGRGKVTRVGTAPIQIVVMWDEARTGALGTNCSGDPTVDLKCYTLDFLP